MKLNRKLVLVAALVLSVAMATTGTLAYLTDRDTAVNTFTMGNVDIEVEEVFDQESPLYPGVEVNKDASIKNTHDTNPAYVWMTVSVPAELDPYIDLVWADGYTPEGPVDGVLDDGTAVKVYTVKFPNVLPAGQSTDKILDAVKLSGSVDYQDGKYVSVVGGVVTEINITSPINVIVDGYAIQTEGFTSVDDAYNAYVYQWGGLNGGESGAGGEEDDPTPVYDPRAEYNGVTYESIYAAVEAAKENGGGTVKLLGSATLDKELTIPANITIEGNGHVLSRADGYTGTMFTVGLDATLTMKNVTLDGAGATAAGNLIATNYNGSIVLNEGTVLKNNNGAHAVSLATRGGGTLTLNGAEISNNSSDSGAIWGGGNIIVNEGSKINNNSSTGSAGAIRMVSDCNLTMNGGEICGNTAVGDGGAIWGYGASTYNLNGGKISGNTAASGGAMYTGDRSTVNITGSFELSNNTAGDAGALRLSNYTAFNMSGGKVSGNESTNNDANDGFYGWNPNVNISGGELVDNITIQGGLTPTVGGSGITGIIYFDLSTTHNTANLAANFGTIQFHVAVKDNFTNFNFNPAEGYTYTQGDEAKLICMNAGYSTYWDAATGTFKLKAN